MNQAIFARLTNQELVELYILIRSGRERAYYATGKGADARYLTCVEASEILTDIHVENAQRGVDRDDSDIPSWQFC